MTYTSAPLYCVVTCGEGCIKALYYSGSIVCIVLSVLTCILALYNIIMHFINFNNPYFQSKIIILMLMPPIFCFTSTASYHSRVMVYLTLIRDGYEIIALFAFFYLIFSFVGYNHTTNQLQDRKVYQIILSESTDIPHDFPCSCFQKPYQLSNWMKAKYFTHRCKRMVLQYIFLKMITTLIIAIFYPNYELIIQDLTKEDYIVYRYIDIGVYWITTISSYIAYYYITLFYKCLQKTLRPFKPDLKFTTFNITLFFIYWQKVWLVVFQSAIIACFHEQAPSYNRKSVIYGLQHILVCIEMFFLVFAYLSTYSYQHYTLLNQRQMGSLSFIVRDIIDIFKKQLRLIKPKNFGFVSKNDKTETELMTITSSMAKKNAEMGCRKNIRADAEVRSRIISNYF